MAQLETRQTDVPMKLEILMTYNNQDDLKSLVNSYLSNIVPKGCTVQFVVTTSETYNDYQYRAFIIYTHKQDTNFVWNSDDDKWQPRET